MVPNCFLNTGVYIQGQMWPSALIREASLQMSSRECNAWLPLVLRTSDGWMLRSQCDIITEEGAERMEGLEDVGKDWEVMSSVHGI